MNYNETVDKVMVLLKEKEVCSSSRRSHMACYESLGLFVTQSNKGYSDAIRERWLADIKKELPRQRCAVWEQMRINWKKWTPRELFLIAGFILIT